MLDFLRLGATILYFPSAQAYTITRAARCPYSAQETISRGSNFQNSQIRLGKLIFLLLILVYSSYFNN